MNEDLVLKDGSKIAIIGGGPAGSFFAHFAQKWAVAKEMNVSITIFDGKDFLQCGPRGCNLCAGVIAESLNEKLKEEGIFLPEERIVNRVEGYYLHVYDQSLYLSCAENKNNTIATVFRGNGPRYSTFPDVISFDDFLLRWVQDRGAKVIPQPVWNIELFENKKDPVRLFYGEKEKLQEFEADLIVGSFGVNTHLMKKIQNLGFGYELPSTLIIYQAELKLGCEEILERFGNTIHVYMPKSQSIRYATIIPKNDYITITLIGKENASKNIFQEFIALDEIKGKVPMTKPHCFCYPRIAVSPSKNPFTHRLVMIGDSSFSRHYKNGIESAFITAELAAENAFCFGVDSSSFSAHYYKRAKRLIINDNSYGRFLFFLNDIISSIPLFTQSHLTLAKKTSKDVSKKLRFMLWNMFTGNIPYKDIFKIALDIRLQTSILFNTIRLLFQKIKHLIERFDTIFADALSTKSEKK